MRAIILYAESARVITSALEKVDQYLPKNDKFSAGVINMADSFSRNGHLM
jgi:hypothetical protein